MNQRRIAIALLSTLLGRVSAFGRPSLPRSNVPSTTTKLSADASETKGEIENSRDQLMDEVVLLYSVVSTRTNFDDNTESEHDILKLRSDELSTLFEDAVFDERGIVREGSSVKGAIDAVVREEPEETLDEISAALDEAILLGYEAAFTENELEEWIERVKDLEQKLQSTLAALPPATSFSESSLPPPPPPPPTPLDKLHGRLESLRTLVDPEGTSMLRLPVAQPAIVATPPKPQTEPKAPVEENKTSEPETTSNESITEEKEDEPSELELENAFLEAANTAAESTSDAPVESKIEPEDTGIGGDGQPESTVENKGPAVVVSSETPSPEKEEEEEEAPTKPELDTAMNQFVDQTADATTFPPKPETSMTGVEEEVVEETENASIESLNEAAELITPAPDQPSEPTTPKEGEDGEEDVPAQSETENTLGRFVEQAADATTFATPPKTTMAKVEEEEEDIPTKEIPTKVEIENAFIASVNKAAESMNVVSVTTPDDPQHESDLSPHQQSLAPESNSEEQATIPAAKAESETEAPTKPEGPDTVSTVVSAAALGAAAVTANPLILAGVALGPVIRDSIESARSRMKKAPSKASSKKAATTTPPEAKPKAQAATKTQKPKAQSVWEKAKEKNKAKEKTDGDANQPK